MVPSFLARHRLRHLPLPSRTRQTAFDARQINDRMPLQEHRNTDVQA